MLAERTPQYIAEAERILGTTAFYDKERTDKLAAGRLTFTAETAGMRGILYARFLRLYVEAMQIDIEHPDHALRPSRGGTELNERARDIARQVAVINTAERTLAEREESFLGGLRAKQEPYMHDIIDFMNAPTKNITATYTPGAEHYVRGALVEAPTGIGKTVLIARTLAATGVGRPIENIKEDNERVRALIIVPSQTIVEQMSGKVSDDTLRKFAPGVNVGAYYQFEKDHQADAVVITIDQFVAHFRNGMLFGDRFDICIIDEAHHILEPQFQEVLLNHWRGPIIGFTATPEYSQKKDARNILPHHIFHGDLLDMMTSEEALLNAAQLYEVRLEYDRYLAQMLRQDFEGMSSKAIEQLVLREGIVDYLTPMVADGRRGIVFCEQGGDEPSGYAKQMAARLRKMKRPDGSPLRVAVAGSLNKNLSPKDPNHNTNIRRRYREGELDFIVTVDWGREGLNEEIDVVAVAGKVTSPLKFLQEIGRGTRLSKQFPITQYGHIFLPSLDRKAVSLFGVLGFETVDQGSIIGLSPEPKNPKGETAKKPSSARTPIGTVSLDAFPDRIRPLIESIQKKRVADAILHPDVFTPVPDEYKTEDEMLRDVPGTRATIRRHLRVEKGFACIGRYELPANGQRRFVFYYEPNAHEYLNTFRGAVARVELQREFGGVDVSIVDALADEVGVHSILWFYPDGKYIPHYTKESAAKIRAAFASTPPADPTDYNRPKLAAKAGVAEQNLASKLTPGERAQKARKRTTTANGKIRVLDHWTKDQGDAIIERLRAIVELEGEVPPYLVPRDLVLRYLVTSKTKLEQVAAASGEPVEIARIARSGRPPKCLTWKAFREAILQLEPRHQIPLDLTGLPLDAKDHDPHKVHKAHQIIATLQSLPPAPGERLQPPKKDPA